MSTAAGTDRMAGGVGIVADDLTGANDCVVQFSRTGWSSRLALTDTVPGPGGGTAVAVVTDARPMPPDRAAAVTRDAVRRLSAAGAERLYLKIDSTMRGSVTGQVAGALDAWRTVHPDAFAVVCPAYPAMGRAVVDRRLLVSGTPVADTGIGRDPVTPVSSSDMGELLPGSSHVGLDRATAEDLAAAIASAAEVSPRRVVTIEARTDADLATLAAAIDRLGPGALPVGSAGLAIEMAKTWGSRSEGGRSEGGRSEGSRPAPETIHVRRVLVVLSSLNAVSREQVDVLVRSLPEDEVRVLTPEPGVVTADDAPVAAWLDDRLTGGTSETGTIVVRSPDRRWAAAPGEDAGLVARTLAAVAHALVARTRPDALVLAGGDGARAVLETLGARAVRVAGAVAEGVPLGYIEGGVADGAVVVTKAGGFGAPGVLVDVVSALRGDPVASQLEVDR